MKVLLDESVPQKLRLLLGDEHNVATTAFQGWSGLKNGALLTAAEQDGFEVFVTCDQELRYQQNLSSRAIAVLILSTNSWEIIQQRSTVIMSALRTLGRSDVVFLPLGR